MYRLLLLLFFSTSLLQAQDYTNSWNEHYSYYNVQDFIFSGTKVYAAAESSVFVHDINSQFTETISSVQGLSGEKITSIHYSEAYELLIIGYETGLIEIKRKNNDDILKVIDILEKQTIAPTNKHVNQFYEYEGRLFIATGYGISEYDLENLEFGDTYYIGENGNQLNVAQVNIQDDIIYAATSGGGLKYANVENPNLVDFNQWEAVAGGFWKGIASIESNLFAVSSSNALYRVSNFGLTTINTIPGSVQDIRSNNEFLIVTTNDKVFVYNQNAVQVNSLTSLPGSSETLSLNTANYDGTYFYLGHTNLGLIKTNPATATLDFLSPEGPLFNGISSIETAENQLWAVFDDYDLYMNPYPITSRGASHLINEEWHNLSSEELFDIPELSNITINPNNSNEVFLSSNFRGLLKLVNETPEIWYNQTNGLDELNGGNSPVSGDVRINGAAFDSSGNLWFVNSRTAEGLKVLTPEGEIEGVDITSVISDPAEDNGFSNVVIDSNNNIYFGTTGNGVIAYNPNTGNLQSINISEANLPSNVIRGLAIDNNNALWIGTNRGLRVVYNPSSVFSQQVSANPIIILDDDGVAQELLFEQFISDIEVDGANNKWLATTTSGVFHVSQNGQDLLAHYTSENSPLPSDNITDVGIDHASGRVYFATVNGLVSVKGTATQARENLDGVYTYPNPVRPGFMGNVVIDGLMQNANVKITDINGNLVYEEVAQGGSILWDTTAFGKYKVASGVYLVLITSEDQAETKVTKIMVVR